MSVGNASPLGEAVSEETLVNIPEELAAETTTESGIMRIDQAEDEGPKTYTVKYDDKGKPVRIEVHYNWKLAVLRLAIPLAIMSIPMVIWGGALFLAFSTNVDDNIGSYSLTAMSAILLTILAFTSLVLFIKWLCPKVLGW